MSSHLISGSLVDSYTAAPSTTKVGAVKSLHENIRAVLGSDYETFLQGSYKNDTSIPDLNDVDIVAVRKTYTSCVFTNTASKNPVSWETIFQQVQDRLEGSSQYHGKTKWGDKCIKVNTGFKADVVPAVAIGGYSDDPIAIYSFEEREERKNSPRDHYENGKKKQAATENRYKPTVRMFKQWARNWFEGTDIAPSFYVECLIHSLDNYVFDPDPVETFDLASYVILYKMTEDSYLSSVAGDKDILVASEWLPSNFQRFRNQLKESWLVLDKAQKATSISEANSLWRKVFND